MKILAAICACLLAMLSCRNSLTTDELLNGNFVTAGQTAIDLLSPTQDQQVSSSTPTFIWGARSASLYLLEIATDSQFGSTILSKEITGTQYTLANSDLQGISSLNSGTYFWRVKVARIANNLQSKTGSFFLFALPSSGSGYAGEMYVDANGTGLPTNGAANKPFRSIQAAIASIDSVRAGNFAVSAEIRVAKGTYIESLNLSPGIALRGGYDSTNWARNIGSNTTTIQFPTSEGIYCDSRATPAYVDSTIVDGFNIVGPTKGGQTAILSDGGSLTIINNYIYGGDVLNVSATANVTGIGQTGIAASYLKIRNNKIVASNSCSTGCAYFQAITIFSAQADIINNIIVGGNQTSAVGITGITVLGLGVNVNLLNNTILGNSGGAANARAIVLQHTSGTVDIKNNIIFNLRNDGTAGFGICIYENPSSSPPTTVQNNNLFGCQYLYVEPGGAGNVSLLTTALTSPAGTLQSMGNISVSNSGGQLFANANGTDGILSTPLDNDWKLTTNAAICNVRGGGLNLLANLSTDMAGLSRTITPIAGCTPSNIGAAGFSIGAYESD